MVLIAVRIQAKIPIILMGETGIGKTALVVMLASIMRMKLEILNLHAGIN